VEGYDEGQTTQLSTSYTTAFFIYEHITLLLPQAFPLLPPQPLALGQGSSGLTAKHYKLEEKE